MGTTNGTYTQVTNVGSTTSVVVNNLTSGTTYYFAITAYDSACVQSPYSKPGFLRGPVNSKSVQDKS